MNIFSLNSCMIMLDCIFFLPFGIHVKISMKIIEKKKIQKKERVEGKPEPT
jgi:hypothetical protein